MDGISLIFSVKLIILCMWCFVYGQEKGSTVGKKCEYVLQHKSFFFTSPGYPEFYPNRATCKWKIIADLGYQIQLTIIELGIENSKHCRFDSVTIYDGDGNTAIPLKKLCGNRLPEIVQSVGNVMTVVMKTDGDTNGRGFQMKYEALPACLYVSKETSGSVESPGYPFGYPDGIHCTYHFPVIETNKHIHLYFDDFKLEDIQNYECFDHLALMTKNGDNEEEKLDGQFCGETLAKKSLCFNSSTFTMKFVTDKMWNLKGFKMSYMISDDKCSDEENIERLNDMQGRSVRLEDIKILKQLLELENEKREIKSVSRHYSSPTTSQVVLSPVSNNNKRVVYSITKSNSLFNQPMSRHKLTSSANQILPSTIPINNRLMTPSKKESNSLSNRPISNHILRSSTNQIISSKISTNENRVLKQSMNEEFKPLLSDSQIGRNLYSTTTNQIAPSMVLFDKQSKNPTNLSDSDSQNKDLIINPSTSILTKTINQSKHQTDLITIHQNEQSNSDEILKKNQSAQETSIESKGTQPTKNIIQNTRMAQARSKADVKVDTIRGNLSLLKHSMKNTPSKSKQPYSFKTSTPVEQKILPSTILSPLERNSLTSHTSINLMIESTASSISIPKSTHYVYEFESMKPMPSPIQSTTESNSKRINHTTTLGKTPQPNPSSRQSTLFGVVNINLPSMSNKDIMKTPDIPNQSNASPVLPSTKTINMKSPILPLSSNKPTSQTLYDNAGLQGRILTSSKTIELGNSIQSSNNKQKLQTHSATTYVIKSDMRIKVLPSKTADVRKYILPSSDSINYESMHSSPTSLLILPNTENLKPKTRFTTKSHRSETSEAAKNYEFGYTTATKSHQPKTRFVTKSHRSKTDNISRHQQTQSEELAGNFKSETTGLTRRHQLMTRSITKYHRSKTSNSKISDSTTRDVIKMHNSKSISSLSSGTTSFSTKVLLSQSISITTALMNFISKSTYISVTSSISPQVFDKKKKKKETIEGCSKYLTVEIRNGKLPLSRLNINERHHIQEILESNIVNAYEVAWPHDGIMGGVGLMNYGTLVTVQHYLFLLRIHHQRIKLVQITDQIIEQYQMEKLMQLPITSVITIEDYLSKIPSKVTFSVLIC